MNLDERIEAAIDCLRGDRDTFRVILQPESVLRRMCETAMLVASNRGVPAWSVIGEVTGHGSGVSSAILKVYGGEHDETR